MVIYLFCFVIGENIRKEEYGIWRIDDVGLGVT